MLAAALSRVAALSVQQKAYALLALALLCTAASRLALGAAIAVEHVLFAGVVGVEAAIVALLSRFAGVVTTLTAAAFLAYGVWLFVRPKQQ